MMDNAQRFPIEPKLLLDLIAILAGVLLLFAQPRSLLRNHCYVALLHGDWACARAYTLQTTANDLTDQRLALWIFLVDETWDRALQMLPNYLHQAKLFGERQIIEAAEQKYRGGNLVGSVHTLDLLANQGCSTTRSCYSLGLAYREVDRPSHSIVAFQRGIQLDSRGSWSAGHYYLAKQYYDQRQWSLVAKELSPWLIQATDREIQQKIDPYQLPGYDWQGVVLMLGEIYLHMDQPDLAMQAFNRLLSLRFPNRDWTLNRALVYLAEIETRQGHVEQAYSHLVRALDLALGYPDSYRGEYERETWGRIVRLICSKTIAPPSTVAKNAILQNPLSPGAWYMRGLVYASEHQTTQSQTAYLRAHELAPVGAGSFALEMDNLECPP